MKIREDLWTGVDRETGRVFLASGFTDCTFYTGVTWDSVTMFL